MSRTRPRSGRCSERVCWSGWPARLVDGVITVAASEQRSQLQNREAALRRLATILAKALAPPPPRRRPTKASRSAVERRLADKKRRREDQAAPSRERDDD